ncbi:DUF559 domain-containing protein [Parvularcula sp. ZS-1/3]|uniref:DUF559 domain-containing protein n=1 Tax=Parvularcula mediterranea TaxID=2732508 RepID=A0A7Y3RK99_9PROT|nr:DUF559 domain-containing protein [Parvularcula mediterranea]
MNTSVTARARALRQRSNGPEQTAWQALRLLRNEGWTVRRQHPVGRFLVDFAIRKLRLAIEVDGGIHRLSEVQQRDAERQKVIEGLGWRFLRIDAQTALSKDHVLELVRAEIESLSRAGLPSPPAPLPEGRGEKC